MVALRTFCLIFIGLYFYIASSYSSEFYFLCGPDEDGCFEDAYSSCACVPFDNQVDEPHCLDFSRMWCVPLSDMPNCSPRLTFINQASCVATIFHSTRRTPCRVKSREFCIEHQISFCEHNGDPGNCHLF